MNALAQPALPTLPLYARIGQRMAQLIEDQVFKPGQRLPSVRDLATQNGVSISTAVQVFHWLEERQLAVVKPRSGYFVGPRRQPSVVPTMSQSPRPNIKIALDGRAAAMMAADPQDGVVSFAATQPGKESGLFDAEWARMALAKATRSQRKSLIEYMESPGTLVLREAVTRRALHLGCLLDPQVVVITSSCIQSIALCLRAVTQPGDVVALESPTHFGFLNLLASLSLKVLEIPTHPQQGMSLPALQLALDTQPVKAVLCVPTLSNPLGATMRHNDKQALVKLLASHQIPLIEDVVFNDLLASDSRRKAAKAFDQDGGVMVCGAFSKTVVPGIRLGWVQAGRWKDAVAQLKRVQGGTTNTILEHALADLLTQSGYEARMRRLSAAMKQRLDQARVLIRDSFPVGTRVSAPPAGYTLWVELPHGLNAMALLHACVPQGVTFGPGGLFSATHRFDHCMRLSFAGAWGQEQRRALVLIGQLAKTALASNRL